MGLGNRLFIKVQRDNLPQIKDRYPFLYLEHGRLEVDDSSVKWIDSEANVVRIPSTLVLTILLGPGTSITHEAVKVLASSNCTVCWVGSDSYLFYAVGQSPTSNTRNMRAQIELATDPKKRLEVARRMFLYRFPKSVVEDKTLPELMAMEGKRVKETYVTLAKMYGVGWKGRSYTVGNFELSDTTNKIITAANAALYAILTSVVYSMGFSPHVGFIHSGSPLPFIYDLSDLYKEKLCYDLAFSLTYQMGGKYNRHLVAEEFRKRLLDEDIVKHLPKTIKTVLGMVD